MFLRFDFEMTFLNVSRAELPSRRGNLSGRICVFRIWLILLQRSTDNKSSTHLIES